MYLGNTSQYLENIQSIFALNIIIEPMSDLASTP